MCIRDSGNTTGPDDGYFRVYQVRANSAYGMGYAMARTPSIPAGQPIPSGAGAAVDSTLYSWNCGVTVTVGGLTTMPTQFAEIPALPAGTYRVRMLAKQTAYDNARAECFLGGDPRLNATGLFTANDAAGNWLPRTAGSVPAVVSARPDGPYLWPLSARYNPNFRGVIFVEGRVGVSGTVRGRVTVASRDNMVVRPNLLPAPNPR